MSNPLNPRYLAYCRDHGVNDPETMLARDRQSWPGGHMAGFTLWISIQWDVWKRQTGWQYSYRVRGFAMPPILTTEDQRAFTAWLYFSVEASVEYGS